MGEEAEEIEQMVITRLSRCAEVMATNVGKGQDNPELAEVIEHESQQIKLRVQTRLTNWGDIHFGKGPDPRRVVRAGVMANVPGVHVRVRDDDEVKGEGADANQG
jgi:hypothetical protein